MIVGHRRQGHPTSRPVPAPERLNSNGRPALLADTSQRSRVPSVVCRRWVAGDQNVARDRAGRSAAGAGDEGGHDVGGVAIE